MSFEFRKPADAVGAVAARADARRVVDDPAGKAEKPSGKPTPRTACADDAQAFKHAMARDEAPADGHAARDEIRDTARNAACGKDADGRPTAGSLFFGWVGARDYAARVIGQSPAPSDTKDAPLSQDTESDDIDPGEADSQIGGPLRRNLLQENRGETEASRSDGGPGERAHGQPERHRKTAVSAHTDHAAQPPQADVIRAPQLAPPSAPEAPMPTPLTELVNEYVSQLLVDEGTNGRRAVHIELKDNMLAGVSLAIHESAGTLVSAFTCGSDAAYQTLGANAGELARSLAHALGRPARVEVRRDALQDAGLVEANAQGPA